MFQSLPVAPPDSILGLGEAFKADKRPTKINLTVGIYQDPQGRTPILDSVKSAEHKILHDEKTKTYLGIEGMTEFNRLVVDLVVGGMVSDDRVAAIQTPGGTGACRVGAELVAKHFPGSRIWTSNPTWANHPAIFQTAGLAPEVYPYLNAQKTGLDIHAMLKCLETQTRPGDLVCLHACCHNPTGVDPKLDEWKLIGDVLSRKQLLPFVDFAYQGFGDGIVEDQAGLAEVLAKSNEAIVCASFSKNFGLYSERVGAALVITADAKAAIATLSQMKQTVRTNYSNPPRHGGAIVATVLGDSTLRSQWESEVNAMRKRITDMRTKFVAGMKATGVDRNFDFLLDQKGMFSYTGLNAMQADWLRNEKGIYILGTGRINVAGMNDENIPIVCNAVAECLTVH